MPEKKSPCGKPVSDVTLDRLVKDLRLPEHIRIARPSMPDFDQYTAYLRDMWETGCVTNIGKFHREFELRLCEKLGVNYINLFCNGTTALLVALRALDITGGQVITTPFTFPATVHALHWSGVEPVFCDVDPRTMNLDPNRIEELITPATQAILPVHLFGAPCDVKAIDRVASAYGLKVLYDAAHAFGVFHEGRPLCSYGDMAILSFHAAKAFNCVEGGALVPGSEVDHRRIDNMRNFGIIDEETVAAPGINGKMSELHAAFGLLQLDQIDAETEKRRRLDGIYREGLDGLLGISLLEPVPDTRPNYGFFPLRVDASLFGMNRDDLCRLLLRFNVGPRKYFHPLCNHFPCYASLPSANPDRLPAAEALAQQVMCLPIYGLLAEETAGQICRIIRAIHELAAAHPSRR